MKKRYRWNYKTFLVNVITFSLMCGTGLLIGWIFAQWAMA